jgi:hypothetical protein
VFRATFGFYKAAALLLGSDDSKLHAIVAHAMLYGFFWGHVRGTFSSRRFSPFWRPQPPESAALIIRIKKAFVLSGLFSSMLIEAVIMAQAMRVAGKERATLSIVFLSSLAFKRCTGNARPLNRILLALGSQL